MKHSIHFAVMVVFANMGFAQTILREHAGPQLGSGFGAALEVLNDLDGDGYPEYFVGAPYATVNGMVSAGLGYVYSGANGAQLYAFQAPSLPYANGSFGFSACSAGDFDNDGVTDILIGEPNFGLFQGIAWTGKIHAFSGADGAFIQSWSGDMMRRQLGYSLEPVGDLNGDGKSEFLVGVAMDEYFVPGYAEVRSGANGAVMRHVDVAIGDVNTPVAVLGDVNGDGTEDYGVNTAPRVVTVFSGTTGLVLHAVSETPTTFGVRLAGVGDLDGDGRSEFAVAAVGAAEVFVYSGGTGTQMHHLQGIPGSGFGMALSGAGDVNGDGTIDFCIGSPLFVENGVEVGKLDMFCGATGIWLYERTGGDAGLLTEFGHAVARMGDLNGDGLGEVLVGARSIVGSALGSAFVLGRNLSGPEQVQVCIGSTHSEGTRARVLAISPSDFSVAANDLTLGVVGLPTNIPTTAMFLLSRNFGLVPNPVIGGAASGGNLCIAGGGIARFNKFGEYYYGSQGSFRLDPDLTQVPWVTPPFTTPVLPGETWYWQCWYRDSGAGSGASQFSDALSIRFQ